MTMCPKRSRLLGKFKLPAWLQRWAARFLSLPVVLALANAPAWAQAPTPRSVINKMTINLPILLDNGVRPQLQEVQLYVKETPSSPWTLKERVPPTQTFFNYRAAAEGEYAFQVVTVDRAGRSVPADVNKEAPALVVVVDLSGPRIQNLHLLETSDKGQNVLVEIQDENYDPLRTRFFYQTGDKLWRTLECMPGTPEQFCIPAQAALTGMVRVQAFDKAGNSANREFNLHGLNPVAGPVTPMTPAKGPGVVMVDGSGHKTHLTPPPAKEIDPPAFPPPLTVTDVPKGTSLKDRVKVVHHTPEVPPPPLVGPGGLDVNPPRMEKNPPISVEVPPTGEPSKLITLPPKLESRDGGPRELPFANCQMANNTRVFLDYQIEALGASGVGRVEVWLTRDKGQSWNKVGEDKDLKSPAEVTLPGEGIFGISLVVTNGRGFGGTAPQPGDQADYWIEVDVTRPTGEIMAVRPSGADDGSLFITWNARDKKLAAEPIDLFFATTREGPWTPIAKGVKNDGSYRWVPPRDMAPHAFVRMVVHDQAGNFTTCETAHPVALDDLSRPRGRVLGVTTTPRGGILE
jgi:hypothetical protein